MADNALRTPVIAGNWKMHKGPSETREFFRDFTARYAPRDDRTVIFFPPAISLAAAADALAGRDDLGLGVQNIHWEPQGAFTGETSIPMARDAGARYALIGHSERRHIFGESDEDVRRKTAAALDGGLIPVVCLGETLEQREAGQVAEVIAAQVRGSLAGVAADQVGAMVIAYEPIWAIGTGRTATPGDADEGCGLVRRTVAEVAGDAAAETVRVQYGGSVKPGNVAELMAQPQIDGALVGGASLDAEDFAVIARYHRL